MGFVFFAHSQNVYSVNVLIIQRSSRCKRSMRLIVLIVAVVPVNLARVAEGLRACLSISLLHEHYIIKCFIMQLF